MISHSEFLSKTKFRHKVELTFSFNMSLTSDTIKLTVSSNKGIILFGKLCQFAQLIQMEEQPCAS